MIQIFFFGSSSIYGVGGTRGGYADIVKQVLHKKMFDQGGIGEKFEVYNFGKSGATIDFVANNFPQLIQEFGRGGTIITILNVGGNNAKAEDEPGNFVSTQKEYSTDMARLLDEVLKKSTHTIAVGSGYYDESKTNPKHNPLSGGQSYFSNERSGQFQEIFKQLCDDRDISFLDVGVTESEWKSKYLYIDGLHANNDGHALLAEKIISLLENLLHL